MFPPTFTLLFLLLLLAIISSVKAATGNDNFTALLSRNCNGTAAANPESFDVNFVDAMEIVSQGIASSGFGMSESGENASDKAYGLGQCLNYLSNVDCRLCYSESRVDLPFCLPSTSARVYLNGCFLRYGNHNFSEEAVDDLDSLACGSSGNVSDGVRFSDGANGLIQNLTTGAYQDANYYKQGNATISSAIKIYGVAQCWRSLNRTGCRYCLEKAQEKIVSCFPASEGAALNAGCVVRYSLKPFYVASSSSSGSSGNWSISGPQILPNESIFICCNASSWFFCHPKLGLVYFWSKLDSHQKLNSRVEQHFAFMVADKYPDRIHKDGIISDSGLKLVAPFVWFQQLVLVVVQLLQPYRSLLHSWLLEVLFFGGDITPVMIMKVMLHRTIERVIISLYWAKEIYLISAIYKSLSCRHRGAIRNHQIDFRIPSQFQVWWPEKSNTGLWSGKQNRPGGIWFSL